MHMTNEHNVRTLNDLVSTTNIISTCMIVRYITVTTETCRQKIRELEKKGELTKTMGLTKLVNLKGL